MARRLVAEPLEVILVRFYYRAAEPFEVNTSLKVALHSEMRAIYQVNAGILAGFRRGKRMHNLQASEVCEADVRGARKH